MFEKFGEFDSVEELNKAAEKLKQEKKDEELVELAKENGLDEEDALDYFEDLAEEFASAPMAAMGRILIEEQNWSKKDIMERMALKVIVMILRGMIAFNEELAAAVVKKGKRMDEIYNKMRDEASKHKTGNIGVSCGTDEELREIIRAYYLDTGIEERLKALYQ